MPTKTKEETFIFCPHEVKRKTRRSRVETRLWRRADYSRGRVGINDHWKRAPKVGENM